MKNIININETKQSSLTFEKPGSYAVYFENLSGDLVFNIKCPGVKLDIYGLFVGRGDEEFKINTFQNHLSPDSVSNLLIKGVFYDRSQFYYRGLVRIEKDAQKSHAYQKNQNLIMSDYAFVESRPYLEILANDVFCTHGSTTGRLNSDQMFYAKTRGLDEKNAEELLVEGFINEIKNKI